MNSAIIIAIGTSLLLLLWAWGRRRVSSVSQARPPENSEYFAQLPPPALLARCLSTEDVAFAAAVPNPAVLRLLLRERRRLALEWLRRTRREGDRLFRLHLRTVRHAPDLRPGAEVKLLLSVGLFVAIYQVLTWVVRLYGPLRTQGYVQSVQSLAHVLSNLGGRIAESIGPIPAPDVRV